MEAIAPTVREYRIEIGIKTIWLERDIWQRDCVLYQFVHPNFSL